MKSADVLIVDYGMGNIGSIESALSDLGFTTAVGGTAAELERARCLILPGVGAFAEAMKNLASRGLIGLLHDQVIERRKPVLGICLGMQLFADRSFEGGEHAGLGWIPGEVRRLEEKSTVLPHVGWNDLRFEETEPLFENVPAGSDFYFDHSYHFVPTRPERVVATCRYGSPVTAAVRAENVWGVQFHPEKSQFYGLRLIKNFVRRAGVRDA